MAAIPSEGQDGPARPAAAPLQLEEQLLGAVRLTCAACGYSRTYDGDHARRLLDDPNVTGRMAAKHARLCEAQRESR